jgi:hypothetical protein
MSNVRRQNSIFLDTTVGTMITGISLKTYFSIQHVQAAAYFSRRTSRLERRTSSGPNSDAMRVASRGYVSTTLFTTVAFLEALANELYADAEMPDGGNLKDLDPSIRRLIAEIGSVESVEKSPVMSKFDLMLRAANREPLDKGSSPSQDVATMIRLRNELVHYKAAWFDVGTEGQVRPGSLLDSKLNQQIRGKFNYRAGSAGGLESDSWMGCGCTQWAVVSTIAYADAVFARLGVRPIFDHVRQFLSVQ